VLSVILNNHTFPLNQQDSYKGKDFLFKQKELLEVYPETQLFCLVVEALSCFSVTGE